MIPLISYAAPNKIELLLIEPLDKKRDRVVPIKVYLNKSEHPQPVILFSHGLGGSRENNAYLANYWAAAGYVTVFIQHKGSDIDVWKSAPLGKRMAALKSAISAETAILRFADVHFVIDQLEKWNMQSAHQLNKQLDLEHIGMSGHSFGAHSTLGVAGQKYSLNQNFHDKRIDAFIALSPSPGSDMTPLKAFGHIAKPVLAMTGTLDTNPINEMKASDRKKVYAALPEGNKYQLVLEGAKHFAFGDNKSWRTRGRNPKHHPAIQQISLQFWHAYLKDDADAKKWLQSQNPIITTGLNDVDVWEWK